LNNPSEFADDFSLNVADAALGGSGRKGHTEEKSCFFHDKDVLIGFAFQIFVFLAFFIVVEGRHRCSFSAA